MGEFRRYIQKPGDSVVAVQLDLDTDGFQYEKWGGTQRCKRGDWIVTNGTDTRTVEEDVFARTYRQVSQGLYVKVSRVWAKVAQEAGSIPTHEGRTAYEPGDYIVYNDDAHEDGYAIRKAKFEGTYELVPDED